MLRLHSKIQLPDHMDPEAVPLVDAMNAIPGIVTTESCCGHGRGRFLVFFQATDPDGLFFLSRCIDTRYFQHNWKITINIGDLPKYKLGYLLASDERTTDVYQQANALVENMNYHLNHPNFMRLFDLDVTKFQTIRRYEHITHTY